jgi:hypothetical protein
VTEEQITNRYVRGWIGLSEYRAEMVKFYDREDAREAAAAPTYYTRWVSGKGRYTTLTFKTLAEAEKCKADHEKYTNRPAHVGKTI